METIVNKIYKGATKHCCYGTCNSDSRYPDRPSMQDVFFIRLPHSKKDPEKCSRWVKACSRKKFDEGKVNKDTYICSIHFVGGKGPTEDHPDPMPATATKYDVEKLEKKPRRRVKRRLVLSPLPMNEDTDNNNIIHGFSFSTDNSPHSRSTCLQPDNR
ncbi:hypothetical protein SNE40_014274 [Patella caerulea]|uniref:THAP-type domain-containing protein n=1 Tax=Patella caerulea TaxID=87958 RepID=A0AAN8JKU9_PATCE